MKVQIRRGIFETSSSGASAMVVIGDGCNHKTEVKLEEPFNILAFPYDDCITSEYPIVYATSWIAKLSLIANKLDESSYPIVKEVVEKYVGQKVEIYMYCQENRGFLEENGFEIKEVPECYKLENISFLNNIYEREDYMWDFGNQNFIAVPIYVDPSEYGYETIFTMDSESLLGIDNLFNMFTNKNKYFEEDLDELKWLLGEIIFNEAIAFKVGGNHYYYDFDLAKLNSFDFAKSLDTPYKTAEEALKCKNYYPYNWNVKNGNELLIIGYDGTKIRLCKDKVGEPQYPESIDMKITDKCEHNCPFCYENSSCNGRHGRLDYPFLKTIPNWVEIAVGGGNPLLHPKLKKVAKMSKTVNITINGTDYLNGELNTLNKLGFNAAGVSVSSVDSAKFIGDVYSHMAHHDVESGEIDDLSDLDKKAHCGYSIIVVHVINGVVTKEMLEPLYDKGVKLLILGYKNKGRGKDYLENSEVKQNQQWLYDNLEEVVKHFAVTSFDVLALEQLDVKRFVSDEDWDHYYMGEDGTHSMYIDLVKGEFGISSTDDRRWPVMDDIRDMFKFVREVVESDKLTSNIKK